MVLRIENPNVIFVDYVNKSDNQSVEGVQDQLLQAVSMMTPAQHKKQGEVVLLRDEIAALVEKARINQQQHVTELANMEAEIADIKKQREDDKKKFDEWIRKQKKGIWRKLAGTIMPVAIGLLLL